MYIISAKDLAFLVKEERLHKGWTQAELAKRAAVSRDWLIGLEKAKPSVELALVLRTLKALGLKLTTTPSQTPSSHLTSQYLDNLRSHTSPNTDQDYED